MSDPVYRPDHKPFLNDSTATYLGVFGAVLIAVLVPLLAAGLSNAPELEGVSPEVKQRRITLREQVNGEGRALLSAYGKSTTAGAYRIPVGEAEKLLVNNPQAALEAARGVGAYAPAK